MCAPQEGAEADAGVENFFTISHTSSSLRHSYTINVAISAVGKSGQKVYIYFQEPEGKFGTIAHKKN
jgi:hypothetical protein